MKTIVMAVLAVGATGCREEPSPPASPPFATKPTPMRNSIDDGTSKWWCASEQAGVYPQGPCVRLFADCEKRRRRHFDEFGQDTPLCEGKDAVACMTIRETLTQKDQVSCWPSLTWCHGQRDRKANADWSVAVDCHGEQ